MRFKLPNHSLKSKSVWAAYRAATPIISYYLPKTIHTALIFVIELKQTDNNNRYVNIIYRCVKLEPKQWRSLFYLS